MPRFDVSMIPALFVCCLALNGCIGCYFLPSDESCEWKDDGQPNAEKGSTIQVNGQALRADGTPMTGSILMRDPATANDVIGAIFTLGLSCLKEDLSGFDCGEWRKLSLDSQGKFSLTYPESETHGLVFDKTFSFYASAPDQADGLAGAGVVAGVNFSKAVVNIPTLTFWEPEVKVSEDSGKVTASVSSDPPEDPCRPIDEVGVTFLTKEGWSAWETTTGTAVDVRVLEDFDGVVYATAQTNYYLGTPLLSGYYTSGQKAFQSSSGPAPSRGAACKVSDASYEAGQCPFTDGSSASSYLGGGFVTVDLGEVRPLSLVAARGYFTDVTLAVSTDNANWTTLGQDLDQHAVAIVPPSGTSARYISLWEPFDSERNYQNAIEVREVSAWW